MAEKQDYGSRTEDDPLVDRERRAAKRKLVTPSRLPMVIGLENQDFRATVFGILLFTWLLPSFLSECIRLSAGECYETQWCDTWIVSYVLIFIGMGLYKIMFIYLWHYDFMEESQEDKCSGLLKYAAGAFMFIGGIVLIVAVAKDLDEMCLFYDRNCQTATFGIYFFPIFLTFALAVDILWHRYDIGASIRVRCGIVAGIIFISSLLVTAGLFGGDTSFETPTMAVYQIGWLITVIASFVIFIYVSFGLHQGLKENNLKWFYAVAFFCLTLFVGPTMALVQLNGYMAMSRTTFLVLGLCCILNVELFLL
eukprot:CAMPEP_0197038090 /NCGR_PEP_ID=MMETSP1384-20130603/15118_1 /TAXON_ID=29189 /ORGANISM="Ammonia sp." /LENGTH=308 /DNA_ID=CAMNT_0042468483 /DNA_START=13 /DNA_END=939 /DNA_ORIENTATION=-